MRDRDWSSTPLGALPEWPQSLRSSVSLILDSPLAMIVLWGPELIQIYNDGYRVILDGLHPRAMGQRTQECWPEVWHFNAPIYEAVFRGECRSFTDQKLTILRTGAPEDAWFDLTYSPLRREDDSVGGVLVTVVEVTKRHRSELSLLESEQRQLFLLKLNDALHSLTGQLEIQQTAMQLVAEHLQLSRAFYFRVERDQDGWAHVIDTDYARDPGRPSMAGRHHLKNFGGRFFAQLWEGVALQVADVAALPGITPAELASYQRVGVAAFVNVPLRRNGEYSAGITAHDTRTRKWTVSEIEVLREVGDRTWAAVERARAEKALRESEELYRNLFDSIDEGVTTFEVIFDEKGRAVDWVYLETNAALTRMTGLPAGIIGKRASEVYSQLEPYWLETYGRVAKTGEPVRDEAFVGDLDRWFDFYGNRIGGEGSNKVVTVFRDITGRRRADAALREAQERQAFLLKLSDVLRPLSDPVEIQLEAMRKIGEQLSLSRAQYYEVESDGEHVVTHGGYSDDLPAFVGRLRMDDFGLHVKTALEAGRTLFDVDAQANPQLTPEEVAAYDAIRVRAYLGVPLVKKGRLVALLGLHDSSPHHWTPLEITLVEDVAERTWAAVERARAEAALTESEKKYRVLFEEMSEGYCLGELRRDETGQAIDWRYILMNPALEVHTGMNVEASIGRWFEELFPGVDRSYWLGVFQEVVDAQVSRSFEDYWPPIGRWLAGTASPASDQRYTIFFQDVTERKRNELALRESELRFRTLSDALPALAWWNDAQGENVFVNRHFLEFTGRTAAEIAGTGWQQVIHPDDAETYLGGYLAAVQARRPYHGQARYRRRDGVWRWHECHSQPVLAGDGAYLGDIGVSLDVTERVDAEAARRESEERLRQFGEASQDVLWIRNADTFQWEYLTPAFEFIYGLDRAAALRHDNMEGWLELIVPEDREHAAHSLSRVRGGEWVTFEYRIRRPVDGGIRWLRNTDFPIRDAAGNVTRIGGIGHDITEVKQKEEALAAAELRQRALLEGMPQLVWRAVDSGYWTWASPQWTEYTRQPEPDSHGWGWLDPVHPDDHEIARQAWTTALETGGFAVEYRLRNGTTQQYRWFSTRATPVRNEAGAIIEWLGTSTDIEELRSLQERQQVLVAELQHRTRNLMGVVRSMADKTGRASADLPDFHQRFQDRLEALARVQGLLSRLNEHDRVTFDELIQTEMAALNGNSRSVTLSGPSGVRLRSSSVQTLALAIHELATNAVKYGALSQPSGHLAISWSVNSPGETPWLLIDWRETGVSVPAPGPSPKAGQGRELIERALPYQLHARTRYELTPDGVHCTISLPISETTR